MYFAALHKETVLFVFIYNVTSTVFDSELASVVF